MDRKCDKCGWMLTEDEKFCTSCGSRNIADALKNAEEAILKRQAEVNESAEAAQIVESSTEELRTETNYYTQGNPSGLGGGNYYQTSYNRPYYYGGQWGYGQPNYFSSFEEYRKDIDFAKRYEPTNNVKRTSLLLSIFSLVMIIGWVLFVPSLFSVIACVAGITMGAAAVGIGNIGKQCGTASGFILGLMGLFINAFNLIISIVALVGFYDLFFETESFVTCIAAILGA